MSKLSKGEFVRLERLLSKNLGYDEYRQVQLENEVRKKRFYVNKNKKTSIKIDDEKVDLTKFEELKTYIRDSELITADKGIKLESSAQYNERKMNLYKKYFFRLINRTNDSFITGRYNAYVRSLLQQVEPSFYERMEMDATKRVEIKKIIQKLSGLPSKRKDRGQNVSQDSNPKKTV